MRDKCYSRNAIEYAGSPTPMAAAWISVLYKYPMPTPNLVVSSAARVILRLTEVILRLTEVILRLTEVILRLTEVILRLTEVNRVEDQFYFIEGNF